MGDSLGPDIKEVYEEEGASISIVNKTPIVTGQKILYDINAQGTKPFIREHHIDCSFPYDSLVSVGDVLLMEKTNLNYMVMNKTPDLFENNIVEWLGVIYLCNLPITASIVRPVEVRDKSMSSPDGYGVVNGWQVIADSPIYGLLSDRAFGTTLEDTVQEGPDIIRKIDLYIPKFYDIKPLDRLIVSPTEYYKVSSVQDYEYPGCSLVLLEEDTRPECSVSKNEVYDDYGEY